MHVFIENAHIPCGFRCHTKALIRKKYKIDQESLPFDSGFFTPESIIKFLDSPTIEINIKNTVPCIKKEDHIENNLKGIEFQESTYSLINNFIENNGYSNAHLDSTNGYYTLVKEFGFVLAHYNWHNSSEKASKENSVEKNLTNINEIFKRRKDRLLCLIDKSKIINLYFYKNKSEFMKINEEIYYLSESNTKLMNYFKTKFVNKYINFIDLHCTN